jgi:hypothetical protein
VNSEEKKQAAVNLLESQRWGTAVPPPNLPGELNELRLRHLETLAGVMSELFSECFSDEQLQALLDFYGSEMGHGACANSRWKTWMETASIFTKTRRGVVRGANQVHAASARYGLGHRRVADARC